MQNDFNRATDPNPDFRRMTVDEMKQAIGTLSPLIRDLRRFARDGHAKHIARWKEGTREAAAMMKLLPSAALVMRIAEMPMRNGQVERGLVGLTYPIIDEAVELRAKYKTVWRARPGRKQFDLSKRIGRENVRKVKKIAKDFPFMP
ncbi:MAG: hypothetical protein ACAH80_01355 [Alphaproteobacteria bacterium]